MIFTELPEGLVAKERQIFFVDSCELLKLDEIYPAFTEFAFRYERACFAESL